jgi:hypothetical protein
LVQADGNLCLRGSGAGGGYGGARKRGRDEQQTGAERNERSASSEEHDLPPCDFDDRGAMRAHRYLRKSGGACQPLPRELTGILRAKSKPQEGEQEQAK